LYSYIEVRSQTILNALGGTVAAVDVNTLQAKDLVGLPITGFEDDEEVKIETSDALRHIMTFNLSTFILIVILILFQR